MQYHMGTDFVLCEKTLKSPLAFLSFFVETSYRKVFIYISILYFYYSFKKRMIGLIEVYRIRVCRLAFLAFLAL